MLTTTRPFMALALAWALASPAIAAPVASHRLPVLVDQQSIPGDLYLRFAYTPIERALEAVLAETPPDPQTRAFVELLTALRAGDVGAATTLVDRRRLQKQHPLPAVVAQWRRTFENFRAVTVLGRVDAGPRTLFFWLTKNEDGSPWVRAFGFEQVDGRWRGSLVGSERPVERLVMEAVRGMHEAPTVYAPRPRASTRYAYELQPEITLEFDGQPVAHALPGGTQTAAHPVVALYDDALDALATAGPKAFAARFTPLSKAKIEAWAARATAEEQAHVTRLFTRQQEALFVLEAGPVSILFVADGHADDRGDRPLSWHFAVRDAATGELRLGNFLRAYHLHTLFKDSGRWPTSAAEWVTNAPGWIR